MRTWSDAIDSLLDLRNSGQVDTALADNAIKAAIALRNLKWPVPTVKEGHGRITLEVRGPHPCLRLNDARYITLNEDERLALHVMAEGMPVLKRKQRLAWAKFDRIGHG
jgi:hypothetical protein